MNNKLKITEEEASRILREAFGEDESHTSDIQQVPHDALGVLWELVDEELARTQATRDTESRSQQGSLQESPRARFAFD